MKNYLKFLVLVLLCATPAWSEPGIVEVLEGSREARIAELIKKHKLPKPIAEYIVTESQGNIGFIKDILGEQAQQYFEIQLADAYNPQGKNPIYKVGYLEVPKEDFAHANQKLGEALTQTGELSSASQGKVFFTKEVDGKPKEFVRIFFHPEEATLERFQEVYTKSTNQELGWKLVSPGAAENHFVASPTSSMRTVVLWDAASEAPQPIQVKLSIKSPILAGSGNRLITPREIKQSSTIAHVAEEIGESVLSQNNALIMRESLGVLPPLRTGISKLDVGGMIVREFPKEMLSGKRSYASLTSLMSTHDQEPQILKMIEKAKRLPKHHPWHAATDEEFLEKLGKTMVDPIAYLQYEHGLGVEAHAQNILLELDKDGLPTGKLGFRDMGFQNGQLRLKLGKKIKGHLGATQKNKFLKLELGHTFHTASYSNYLRSKTLYPLYISALGDTPKGKEKVEKLLGKIDDHYTNRVAHHIPEVQVTLPPTKQAEILSELNRRLGTAYTEPDLRRLTREWKTNPAAKEELDSIFKKAFGISFFDAHSPMDVIGRPTKVSGHFGLLHKVRMAIFDHAIIDQLYEYQGELGQKGIFQRVMYRVRPKLQQPFQDRLRFLFGQVQADKHNSQNILALTKNPSTFSAEGTDKFILTENGIMRVNAKGVPQDIVLSNIEQAEEQLFTRKPNPNYQGPERRVSTAEGVTNKITELTRRIRAGVKASRARGGILCPDQIAAALAIP